MRNPINRESELRALLEELNLDGMAALFTDLALKAAKENLSHEADLFELAKLDKFSCVILDDIGYVQHNRDEMEVLFTFLAERYERKSVLITTNLVFSEWNRIFKDPMTTMAAIDRVIHHSVILDMMDVESYRAKEASSFHLQTIEETEAALHPPSPDSHSATLIRSTGKNY